MKKIIHKSLRYWACICLAWGALGGCGPAPEEATATYLPREKDPAYRQQLRVFVAEQDAILKKLMHARAAYEVAKAADETGAGEACQAARAACEAAQKELSAAQTEVQRFVAARIHQDFKAQSAQEKGN